MIDETFELRTRLLKATQDLAQANQTNQEMISIIDYLISNQHPETHSEVLVRKDIIKKARDLMEGAVVRQFITNLEMSEVEALRVVEAIEFKLDHCTRIPPENRKPEEMEFLRYGIRSLAKLKAYIEDARRKVKKHA